MPKVKFDKQTESFFEEDFSDRRISRFAGSGEGLSPATLETSSTSAKTPFFSERSRTVFNVLRQIFLFLPGTFFLYLASVLLTFVLLSGYFYEDVEFVLIEIAVFSVSVLLTVLGLGDVRKPKYFTIPLSTVAVGVLVGILGVLLFDGGIKLRVFLLNSVPYYIPLAFIAPILVKGWLDKTEEET